MPAHPPLADPLRSATPEPAAAPLTTAENALPRWPSQVLLAGGREAAIEHADLVYRLRLTAQGKLILTK